jgi:uncharacterized protein (DUF2461 family)
MRFSKDKTPYKTHLPLWFPVSQGGAKFDHPGYHFHLAPANLMLGDGVHNFSKPHLKTYRKFVINPKRGPSLALVKLGINKYLVDTDCCPTAESIAPERQNQ